MPSQPATTNPGFFQSNEPFSFETKIAMALQGAKWQELQNNAGSTGETLPEPVEDDLEEEDEVLDENKPPELTAKQKKKREQFDRTIARDAGDVLQTIEPDALKAGEQEVIWDQDPEILCCYNWQASSDDTNTIFGKSMQIWVPFSKSISNHPQMT